MERFNIVFKPSVEKDLRYLPQTVLARILKKIQELKNNPISRESIKITGAEHLYRIRVGDYRVIYGIDKNKMEVIIHYVRHRRDVYSLM